MNNALKKIIICGLMFLIAGGHGLVCAQKAAAQFVPADVERQIEKLQSTSAKKKVQAARALGAMGAKATPAVPHLIEQLDSNEIYKSLSDKLWNNLTLLSNSGAYVSYETQEALIRIGAPAVKHLTKALLGHPRPRVRSRVAIVLGRLRSPNAVSSLARALRTDAEADVRMWSAEALGKLPGEEAASALLYAMKDAEANVRQKSAYALGELKAARAVPALMEALKDQNISVRHDAAYALGELKAREAVPALIEMLEADGKQSAADDALYMITGQRLGYDQRDWRAWWEKNR